MTSSDPTLSFAKTRLIADARSLGFDAIGVARVDQPFPAGEHLTEFLAAGRHGDMAWMATTAERRAHPQHLWSEARSAILVGLSYAPDSNPLDDLADRQRGVISVYAKGRDYHDVLKERVRRLASEFATATGADVKIFVDTAPLMEKPLAALAGLGWQGKHTNLVSREHGSWLFLGAILTTAELEPDTPTGDNCGSCRRCLDICPTAAFPAPYQLDARRCLAYLTIEHKGHIPREFREPLANRVFGCDDCLSVCPWNKFAEASRDVQFAAASAGANPPLGDLLALDDTAFRARFAGTPVKRTGRDRVVRNALIAAGNSSDENLLGHVLRLIEDASPIVRAAAIWAASMLLDGAAFAALRAERAGCEADPTVADEWRLGAEDRAA